jgi:hypothetical protein
MKTRNRFMRCLLHPGGACDQAIHFIGRNGFDLGILMCVYIFKNRRTCERTQFSIFTLSQLPTFGSAYDNCGPSVLPELELRSSFPFFAVCPNREAHPSFPVPHQPAAINLPPSICRYRGHQPFLLSTATAVAQCLHMARCDPQPPLYFSARHRAPLN